MKRFLFATLTLCVSYSYSQSNAEYIITLENDTIKGKIDLKEIRGYINFTDLNGSTKKYEPFEIKGFYMDSKHYGSVKTSDNVLTSKNFYEILAEGELTLFKFQESGSVRTSSSGIPMIGPAPIYYYIYNKSDGKTKNISGVFAKNDARKYLSQFPEIKEEVEAKSFHLKHMADIIKKYNDIKATDK